MQRFNFWISLLAALILSSSLAEASGPLFRRGDCNGDGQYNIGDAVITLSGLFSGTTWSCREACDANDDGLTDISDAIFALGSLFAGGPSPPAPFLVCGMDPTPDTLGCLSYPTCGSSLPPIHFDPGFVLLQATGAATLPIPADFFYPGCLPFEGTVIFSGTPLQTAGPFETGTTDTVVRRLAPIDLGSPQPSQESVAIEMVELQLVSVSPIVVDNAGTLESWHVRVELSPVDPHPIGTMDILQTTPTGGTFDMTLPVVPRFVFTGPGPERELTLGCDIMVGPGSWDAPGFGPGLPAFPDLPTFSGSLVSPRLQLQFGPAEPLPIPPANIAPSAVIDPSAQIGRGATIEPGAQIGPNVVIGPHALVGFFSVIQEGAIIGDGAIVSPNCSIGPHTIIDSGAMLFPQVLVGPDGWIGEGTIIEPGVLLGAEVRVGSSCFLGQNAQLGNGVELEAEVFVGAFATLVDGISLPPGVTIFDGQFVSESLVECVLPDGTLIIVPAPACAGLGIVLPEIPGFENDYLSAPVGQEVAPLPPGNVPGGAGVLGGRVDGSGVAPANGGGAWVKDTHDCDDFADELEQALEVFYPGNATFTCIWEVNKDKSWWQFWKPDLINGHALTDLHHNGQTLWIEPQWSVAQGAIGINMDKDGDGMVGYATSPGSGATDGCFRIEVYDSRAACEAAGRVLD
ncbi:MAG: hypothetical protein AB7O52_04400 [Planctomycetota bacterium]